MDSQPDRTVDIERQLQEQLLAGVQGNQKQQGKIRDQLRDMFNPDDYVTVANPFDHATGWAYVDPAEERQERPDKTTKRMHFGKPKARILQPGQQVVIHGWEAYIALGRMFKEYAQMQGSNMIIVLTSQKEIESFLSKAYKGVFDPNQQINAINAAAAVQDIEANKQPAQVPAADPLGFDAPEPTQPTHAGVDLGAPEGDVSHVEPPQGNNAPPTVHDDETVSQNGDSDTGSDQGQGGDGNDTETQQITQ